MDNLVTKKVVFATARGVGSRLRKKARGDMSVQGPKLEANELKTLE